MVLGSVHAIRDTGRLRIAVWRNRWKTAFAKALENGPRLPQQMMRPIMLTLGDQRQRPREHVRSQQLHPSLDDTWMGWNRRRYRPAVVL